MRERPRSWKRLSVIGVLALALVALLAMWRPVDVSGALPEAVVVVEVTDAAGAVAEGASVRLISRGTSELVAEAVTGTDGTARFADAGDATGMLVCHGDRAAYAPLDLERMPARVVLQHGVAVRVRVTDPEGEPLAAVPVAVRLPTSVGTATDDALPSGWLRDGTFVPESACSLTRHTGLDGVAEFGVVPFGRDESRPQVVLDVSPWMTAHAEVTSVAGGEIEFALHRAVDVTGRVRDSAGKRRARYVRDLESDRVCDVAEDGSFAFACLDARGGRLVADVDWFTRGVPAASLLVERPPATGATQELGDLVLPAGMPIRGIAVWPDQSPAAHAEVTAWLAGYSGTAAWRTWADDAGRFETPPLGLAPHDVEVIGMRDGPVEGSPWSMGALTTEPTDGVRIVLARAAPALRVRARTPDGTPLAAGWLRLSHRNISPFVRVRDGIARIPLRGDPPWKVTLFVPGFEIEMLTIADSNVVIDRDIELRVAVD